MGFSTYYYHKHCSECSKYSLAWLQWIERTQEQFSQTQVEKLKTEILMREEKQRVIYVQFTDKDDLKDRLTKSSFKSYHEFATHACLPCHYARTNGTDLSNLFKNMPENDLQKYLEVSLNNNMPPDDIFRKILLGKLNFLMKRQSLQHKTN